MSQLGEQIRQAREARQYSQRQLAEELHVSRNAVSNWEGGDDPTLENLRKVQRILQVKFNIDVAPGGSGLVEMKQEHILFLDVRGEVRSGAWLEMHDSQDVKFKQIPVPANPKYSRAPQYALAVVGTSMNRVVKEGEYVIVASWDELGREARDGDLVVVRRERSMTYEVTLKRVREGLDGLELWPESDDPRWQEPLTLSDGDRDVEVKIVGLVIGKYSDL